MDEEFKIGTGYMPGRQSSAACIFTRILTLAVLADILGGEASSVLFVCFNSGIKYSLCFYGW